MKRYLATFTILLSSMQLAASQSHFHGPINFRGRSEGARFSGRDFDIMLQEAEYIIISRNEEQGGKFVVEFDQNSITDVVFSSSRTAIAVAMGGSEWKRSQMVLVTVESSGKKRVFNYRQGKLTERLKWIVELGAVSDNGELVLAKCALMLPQDENGFALVQHEWVVLKVADGSIELAESVNALDKWANYVTGLAEKR